MPIRPLLRSEWPLYLGALAQAAGSVRVRVLSVEGWPEAEGDWASLQALTYDPSGDVLDMAVEVLVPGTAHHVAHPTTLYVDEETGRLARVEVVREDGTEGVVEVEPIV